MKNQSKPNIVAWAQSPFLERDNWESEANAAFRERRKLALELVAQFANVEQERLKNAARLNGLVNLVSALEVYFRDLIVEKNYDWISEGFADLLKDKISLNDAYDFFKNTSITKEALIARHYSFQSIESISYVFDRLTGSDFLKRINESEYLDFADECPTGYYYFNKTFPEWRKELVDLLNKRHRIVHEAHLTEILTEENWEDYYFMLSALPYAIEFALFQLNDERQYHKSKMDINFMDELPF